jgi:hypothetical protein
MAKAATCSLSREALRERLGWIRDEVLVHARSHERLADGVAWELEAVPGLAEKLDRLVALERECCGDLTFERMPGSQPGTLRLELRGIDAEAALAVVAGTV